ncbi:glucosaminidase domain-containing protein [Shewanella sp. KX20019]|uniref:glucosaminidase domain-containing protein n=1 Tax=Shewanella sp. KX20019 TaxID=2803864 RepID=UPI0019263C87|nr:glucosaminidase domain-containing protein [Shewanella sp. KX20019]QQX82370.1 glucosaminidase domain-containing protein [Shewanella sp. KX20019]
MKTGKVGLFTIAFGVVIGGFILIRLTMIPSLTSDEAQLGKAIRNNELVSKVPKFSDIKDVKAKKRAFFNFLRPSVKHQNAIIKDERQFLIGIRAQLENENKLTDADEFRLQQIAEKYQYTSRRINTNTIDKLLVRVDVVPEQMVLIQAANETGWGSSRFAREGLNFFGQWCFRKGCGLVPQSRSDGLSHEVAVFKTVEDSVASYMRNLNSNAAYSLLRSIRADMRAENQEPSANKLVYGLVNYSERQEAYIDELLEMLRQNQPYLVETNEKIPAA